jgi:Bifunctional DNA primase/polymerase, N-terminal
MGNIDREQQNANGKVALPEGDSALEWARAYHKRGFTPIRIPSGYKGPIERNWQNTRYSDETEIEQAFKGHCNEGLKLGQPGLVCVDLDCPEAVMLAPYILPPTGMVGGRASAPDSHYFYGLSAAGLNRKIQFVDPTITREGDRRAMMIEVMVKGQVVVAPSIYADGEACVWREFSEPALIDADALVASTKLLALGALMIRHWAEGIRHYLVLGFSAVLAQAGYSREDADELLAAICHITGDAVENLSNDMQTTFDKLEGGETISSWNWFREAEIDSRVIARVRKWFSFEEDGRHRQASPMATYVKRMAASIEVFRTLDGVAYVTFPTEGGRETQALRSSRFEGWLRHYFFESHDMVIDTTSTNNITSLLEYNAKPTDKRVHLRVAEDEAGDVYIDIGNPERQAIRLSPGGWDGPSREG